MDAPDPRFRAVLEIASALNTTLELDELLARVMTKITTLLDAERSSLFLCDFERGEIWSKVAQGQGQAGVIRLPMGRGIAGFVAETGRTVNVKDAYDDPRFNQETDRVTGFRTRSILAVPLHGKDGRVIGVAQALNKNGSGAVFGLDDERTLSSVSNLIGLALENAQLYSAVRGKNLELQQTQAALRHKVAEVDLLFEIEREISAGNSLDEMLAAILDRAMAVVCADGGAVLLVDGAAGELHVKRAPSAPPEVRPVARAPVAELETWVDAGGQVLVISGADLSRSCLVTAGGRSCRAVLSVPLVVQERSGHSRVFGALELADKAPGEFTEDDRKLAQLVAAQLARAVAVARTRAESERAGRLAALGQMLGGLVHDLRSPMTVIGGYAELMSRETEGDERERFAGQILGQIEHVNAMTREVLGFLRGERQLLLRRVLVSQFFLELLPVLERDFEPRRIRCELQAEFTGAARLDESKLKRLVSNLARNAAQAMTDGGLFRIRCAAEGDTLVLEFADTGPGIPPQVAARLFTAFNTQGKRGGTGLGLAIVKEAVEAHGGHVSFETALGKGTRFVVRLPGAVVS